jgi:hypothetical protein
VSRVSVARSLSFCCVSLSVDGLTNEVQADDGNSGSSHNSFQHH